MAYKNWQDQLAARRRWYAANKERAYEIEKASIAKNKPFYRAKWRRPTRRLTDSYVRQQLSQDTAVPRQEWHPWLVEIKRNVLKLKREGNLP